MRNPFVPAPQYEGYTGYGTQKKRPQTVAEILSEPLGELSPNLGASANSASRQREIADMLTQGAMQQDNTSLAGGLSSLGQAFLARGAQKKADAAEEKYRAMLQALTEKAAGGDEASIAQLLSPEAMIGRKDQQARYSVEDAFRDKAFDRGVLESDRGFGLQKDQFDWQVGTDERNFNRGVEEFDQTFGLNQAQFEEGKRQFGLNYGLDARGVALAERKADQEASAPGLDFGDVYRIRSANEKAIEPFAAAQRQYLMMEDLAKDGTGASDVALGFAFFKTIDPTSTVREGEFAQAASSMGLGANIVQMFKRLDKGEKFSPQLRNELVAAAGRAYNQQKTDIENLVNRETEFATRMNVDPSLVIRDPVRSNQMPGLTPVTPTPAAPPVGTIERGDDGQLYRLRGGDPSDPNSWEPLPASDTGFRFFNNPGVR